MLMFRIFLEKSRVAHLIKKFFAFIGTHYHIHEHKISPQFYVCFLFHTFVLHAKPMIVLTRHRTAVWQKFYTFFYRKAPYQCIKVFFNCVNSKRRYSLVKSK